MLFAPVLSAPASPFMTVDQAAAVLRVQPLQIQRCIALGKLSAFRIQPEAPWNIRPADLEAYAETKFAGLQMPPIAPEGGWYDDRDSRFFYNEFMTKARAAIEAVIPETAPMELEPSGSESYRLFAADVGIQALAKGPQMRHMFKMHGLMLPEFRNAGDQFATHELRRIVASLLKPTGNVGKPSEASKFAKLFDSPEGFRGFLDEAWKFFETLSFSTTKQYRATNRYGISGIATVSFKVPFTVLTLVRPTIEAAAF